MQNKIGNRINHPVICDRIHRHIKKYTIEERCYVPELFMGYLFSLKKEGNSHREKKRSNKRKYNPQRCWRIRLIIHEIEEKPSDQRNKNARKWKTINHNSKRSLEIFSRKEGERIFHRIVILKLCLLMIDLSYPHANHFPFTFLIRIL